MKKIIVAIDGLKYSASAVMYAVHLAKQTHSFLAGVFLDDFTYHSYKLYDAVNSGSIPDEIDVLEEADKVMRAESLRQFEETCQESGLNYSVHHDKSIAIQELLHESIYADLLVIDGKETLTHYEEKMPTRFIRDLLGEVQCPVLVVPSAYRPISQVILLYDGEPSSVYAIRLFSYVFPALKHLDTEVLTVKDEAESLHLPDSRLMKEFMKRHYPKATYTVEKGIPETEIIKYLKKQSNHPLVVLGAYHRGMVSRWFRASMADTLMKELHTPLYIAHNK